MRITQFVGVALTALALCSCGGEDDGGTLDDTLTGNQDGLSTGDPNCPGSDWVGTTAEFGGFAGSYTRQGSAPAGQLSSLTIIPPIVPEGTILAANYSRVVDGNTQTGPLKLIGSNPVTSAALRFDAPNGTSRDLYVTPWVKRDGSGNVTTICATKVGPNASFMLNRNP